MGCSSGIVGVGGYETAQVRKCMPCDGLVTVQTSPLENRYGLQLILGKRVGMSKWVMETFM